MDMSDKPTNPPAFPHQFTVQENGNDMNFLEIGMTLRDYFAGQAIVGIISGANSSESMLSAWLHESKKSCKSVSQTIAAAAYAYADAMLAERDGGGK